MGFFSLFGDKVPNENTSKPFHKNANVAERRDWFARTRPWHRVPTNVINALIARLDPEPATFEVFVFTSMKANIVERMAKLDTTDGEEVICSIIAAWLTGVGQQAARRVFDLQSAQDRGPRPSGDVDEVVNLGSLAIDCFESAVHLDHRALGAYGPLALLLGIAGRAPDALKYARQGLAAVRNLRSNSTPIHLSSIESVRNSGQPMEQLERALLEIAADLEKQVG